MKKLLLVLVLLCSTAVAADLNFGAGYYSAYMFRGEKLLDNACLQPSLSLVSDKLEFKAVSIYDTKQKENYRNVYELKFKTNFGKQKMNVGFVAYDFNKLQGDTQEFFVGTEWDGAFHPYMTVYFDVKEGHSSYVRGGVERQIKSGKDKFAIGASVGYNFNNQCLGFNANNQKFSGLYDGEIYIKSSFHTFKHFIVEPILAYSFPLSQDGKEALQSFNLQNKANNLYGGINVLVTF